jgi:serine/threonine-protein kinase RsbW
MLTKVFPGRFDSLAEISEFVGGAAQDAGFDSKGVYAIKLAVDEACTNIIEHAYGGESKGEIRCTCTIQKDSLEVKLQDWGCVFNPNSIPEPNFDVPIEELKPRGAGLFFMKKFMDEVRFEFDARDGNCLTMIKHKPK